jgi:hypothetical protein
MMLTTSNGDELTGERSQRTLLRPVRSDAAPGPARQISAELALHSRQQIGEGAAVGVLRDRLLRLLFLDRDQSVRILVQRTPISDGSARGDNRRSFQMIRHRHCS